MEDQELEKLFMDLESYSVERKSMLPSNKEKICEAICAFANDLPKSHKPGVLFIGVNDDGSCANIEVNDDLLLSLSDLRSNGNILPFPTMMVQKKILGGCEVAVVIVEPSDDPPVRFRGRTWIRVGPRRSIATPEEERRLTEKRHANYLPFDIRPQPFSAIDDLNIELFSQIYLPSALPNDIIEQNHRTLPQQLAAMRFMNKSRQTNQEMATTLGILVIGKDPRYFIPGTYVQFVRFDGETLADPIKAQREIDGPLPELIEELDDTSRRILP